MEADDYEDFLTDFLAAVLVWRPPPTCTTHPNSRSSPVPKPRPLDSPYSSNPNLPQVQRPDGGIEWQRDSEIIRDHFLARAEAGKKVHGAPSTPSYPSYPCPRNTYASHW